MNSQSLTEISYELTDGIATITLNRPDRLNALTRTMAAELIGVCDAIDADDQVRAVIVTGAGRGFCAGADLGQGADTFNTEAPHGEERRTAAINGKIDGVPQDFGGMVTLRLAALRKPVIAAVNGAAVGFGATMTLPMDIRLAADSARFGFVFTRRGIVPDGASSWFLPRVVGISQAMEWVATGRVFDAQEARTGGLVSRIVAGDELLETARAVAREIVDNTSGVSVALARQLLWSMLGESSPWEAHRLESRALHETGASADAAEGVMAFLEKRRARFPGLVSKDYPGFVPPWPSRPDGL
ncbi:crotonase/enoyl-CoA hydratase family protein [Streptomyces sp. GbtcB7]|uniref:crotonase/enoyl-CoA hydratase family protein n=1 Tax=Streptomyces sp. GbtcB7 TaxID=2824752 RepID=UPI001C2FFB82|nr:crotonase/enoyl-CoA hydratase family protein [Streptomyces sp. GbtcB7]